MKGVDATEQAEGCVVHRKRFCDSVAVSNERCFTLIYIYIYDIYVDADIINVYHAYRIA